MAITIRERNNSREWSGNDAFAMRYVVSGTYNDSWAKSIADSISPASFSTRIGTEATTVYKNEITANPQGPGDTWYVEVKYGPTQGQQPGNSEWNFNIGIRNVHTSHSLETINTYVPDGDAAEDFKQAVNVTGSGADLRVEGVDVPEPTFGWQETLYLKLENFTSAYLTKLRNAVGKTNVTAFRVFGAQEVQLVGISGQPAGNCVAMTFSFAGSPSVEGLAIGDINGIDKKGFEYLWVRYKTDQGITGLTQVPAQVNIEKVIDTYEFADLGIPDPFNVA